MIQTLPRLSTARPLLEKPVLKVSNLVGSLSHYWVGIVLVAIFAVVLNVLPERARGNHSHDGLRVAEAWNKKARSKAIF